QVRSFRSVDISPDGTRVAWVQRIRSREGAEVLSTIDVADIASPATRRVTAANDARAHREHGAVWSPDGKRLAFLSDAAKDKQFQIYVAPASGGPPRRVTGVAGQVGHPKWSPDGRSIAFLFIEGSAGGDIYAVSLSGGEPKNLTPGMKASATALHWRPSGEILFTEHVDGNFGLGSVDPASGAIATLWSGPQVLGSFAAARRGPVSAAIVQSFQS